MAFETQDPDEALTYSISWTNWLSSAATISSGTWSISPSTGVTVSDLGESANTSSSRVSGLTRGVVYSLTNQIIASDGDTGEQSIAIRCEHK